MAILVLAMMIFVYILSCAFVGTRNKVIWEKRHEKIRSQSCNKCSDYFCTHGLARLIGYPFWFMVYPCSLIFVKTESNALVPRTERKKNAEMEKLEAEQQLNRKRHEVDMENARLLMEFSEQQRKALEASRPKKGLLDL